MAEKKKNSSPLKALLKYIIYQLQLAVWLDKCLFYFAQKRNQKKNRQYLQQNPTAVLPADYDLYETFQLDYRLFIEDGKLAAQEIIEWTKPFLNNTAPVVLDWGCGSARVIRNMPQLIPAASLHGCDTHANRIRGNQLSFPQISFSTIQQSPPTGYLSAYFDLIYGLSVFTHIPAEQQNPWLEELHRILKQDAILLVTTQGQAFLSNLLFFQKSRFLLNGIYTRNYPKTGHRMMSTYHTEAGFRQLIHPMFTVLAYYSGSQYPEKMGGQDVWILKKTDHIPQKNAADMQMNKLALQAYG